MNDKFKEYREAMQVASQSGDMVEYDRLRALVKPVKKTKIEIEAEKLGVKPLDLVLSRIEDADYER